MAKDATDKPNVPETLMDAEQQESLAAMQKRAERIARVAREIDDILIREDFTWGEWGEVVELFSNRISHNVAITKVKQED